MGSPSSNKLGDPESDNRQHSVVAEKPHEEESCQSKPQECFFVPYWLVEMLNFGKKSKEILGCLALADLPDNWE